VNENQQNVLPKLEENERNSELCQELTDSFDVVPRVIISPWASSAGSPECLEPTFGW
jgi:hypothetical protein